MGQGGRFEGPRGKAFLMQRHCFKEQEPTYSPCDEVSLEPVHVPFVPRHPFPSSPLSFSKSTSSGLNELGYFHKAA